MLTIRLTPHLAGFAISGDFEDLQRLYDALTELLDEESEPGAHYEMPALTILGACYELRHAWQGNRSVSFIANGMNSAAQQSLKTLGPQQNVYFTTRIALPELLFDVMALDDFIELHSHKIRYPELNRDIQMVKLFQAEVITAARDLLDDDAGSRLAGLMNAALPRFRDYYTQYIDMLTEKYYKLTPDKRLQQIVPLAKRISDRGKDYQRFAADLLDTAAEMDCQVSDLEPVSLPPEISEAEW